MTGPEKKKRRSAVAPLADRRGGPANYTGVGFQTRVAVWYCLLWLREALDNPAAADVVRCEQRTMVEDGQVGFDVGRTNAVRRDLFEVKSKPSMEDVREFLRHAVVLAGEVEANLELSISLRVVSETQVAPLEALERLWRHAQEAADDAELIALVVGVGNDVERDLLAELGDHPMAVMGLVARPEVLPEQVLENMSMVLASFLCEEGRAVDLRSHLTELFNDGNRFRLSKPMTELVAELTDARLLGPPRSVDTSTADPRLVTAIGVLQECSVPLPADVLAAGVEISVDELAEVLAQHVEQGGVLRDEGGRYYHPPRDALKLQADPDATARALRALIDQAGQQREHYAHQAANALSLAEACAVARPEAVTHVFVAFDKGVKAWGDLQLTYRLAKVATEALEGLLAECEDTRQQSTWVQEKVHTQVCGQSWVLQRVGEFEDAHRELQEANALTAEFPDPANHAFGLKCEGRIMRMRAEDLPVGDETRSRLLADSETLLRRAYAAFSKLLADLPYFAEDHGECLSLLARTLATAGRFAEADAEIRRADDLLDTKLTSKAYADLVILKGDLVLARRAHTGTGKDLTEAEADQMRSLLGTIEELIVCHDQIVEERFNPNSSEIAARARVAAGRLLEVLGETGGAEARFREAAELYMHLRYEGAADEALWKAEVVSEEGVPAGLVRAFEEADARATVRLIALTNWRQRTPEGKPRQHAPDVDHPMWGSYVQEATRTGHARRTKWGEGRTA